MVFFSQNCFLYSDSNYFGVRVKFLFRIKIMSKGLLKRKSTNGVVIKRWGSEVPKTNLLQLLQ